MQAYRLLAPAPIETKPLVPVELPIPEPGPGQARVNEANTALDDLKHSRFNGEAVLMVSGD